MPVLDNAKHEHFAQELAKGRKQDDAYEAAGFKRNVGNASKLAGKPEIQARVKEITGIAAEKAAVSKAWVLGQLIANANRAMQGEPVLDDDGEPIGEARYNGAVANRALELIGKELGMFVDRVEKGDAGDFAKMTDAELAEALDVEAKALGLAKAPRGKA